MTGDKGEFSLAELASASRLVNERPMVPYAMDLMRLVLTKEQQHCAHRIEIKWDQWVVCTIYCEHGNWVGTSDFLNLTEAFLRATRTFQDGEHPRICGKTYVDRTPMVDGTVEPLEIDCTLFEGHDGECGGD